MSFDADWKEVYIGASKKDSFTAVCPNNIPESVEVIKYLTLGGVLYSLYYKGGKIM